MEMAKANYTYGHGMAPGRTDGNFVLFESFREATKVNKGEALWEAHVKRTVFHKSIATAKTRHGPVWMASSSSVWP